MGRRRQARELALQALYLSDTARMGAPEALAIVEAGSSLDGKTESFARELAEGAAGRLRELDERIAQVAENWAMDRMAAVDRNLLRLASFELLYCPQTPVNVVINEALEIAKAYSGAEASRFINGILDKVKSHRTSESAP